MKKLLFLCLMGTLTLEAPQLEAESYEEGFYVTSVLEDEGGSHEAKNSDNNNGTTDDSFKVRCEVQKV